MRKIFGTIAVLVSASAYAGGTVGGNPGLAREQIALELSGNAFNLELLPKTYIGGDDFRRVKARLSVTGTQSTPALVDGEALDLKAFRDTVVDLKFSKEILPSN